ncbi:ras-like protein [Anaeramoeba ignava]|uniref:Ras-like protein n=1 Tax=Anaeramoeba ignava TaxID=1746090 RepID=A0A9Q0L8W1_ANAIG|nr:ras-like protein [Anaeramoeba ignava]
MNTLKIVVVGGGGVGKSALTIQFVHSKFIETYEPTIEDSYRRQVEIDTEVLLLEILDTAGQEEYAIIRDTHLRSGDGFMLVFSLTSKVSFQEISLLRDQIIKSKDSENLPILIVGNKSDLAKERKVDSKEAQALAKTYNCQYIETSAKTRTNVDEAFFALAKLIRKKAGYSTSDVSKGPKPPKKKKSCQVL